MEMIALEGERLVKDLSMGTLKGLVERSEDLGSSFADTGDAMDAPASRCARTEVDMAASAVMVMVAMMI